LWSVWKKIHHEFPVIRLMKLFFDGLWTVWQRRQNSGENIPGKACLPWRWEFRIL